MASSSSSRPDALVVAFALGLSVFDAAQLLTTGTGFGVAPTCPSPRTHVDDNVDLDGGQLYQADPLGVEAQTVAGGQPLVASSPRGTREPPTAPSRRAEIHREPHRCPYGPNQMNAAHPHYLDIAPSASAPTPRQGPGSAG